MTKWECIDKYHPTLIINAMKDLGIIHQKVEPGLYILYDKLTDDNVNLVVRRLNGEYIINHEVEHKRKKYYINTKVKETSKYQFSNSL